MAEEIVKRKRGRPPKIKLTKGLNEADKVPTVTHSASHYLSGYGHGQKAPKPSERKIE